MPKPKSKKTSIKDVAGLAGVGVGTVSRVLNNEPNVSEKKRKLILEAIEKLDYSPNIYARGLSGQKSYVLGLFCDDPRGDYVSGIVRGALLSCKELNYHLIVEIIGSEHSTDDLNTFLKRTQLDGAIVLSPLCDDKALLNVFDKNKVSIARISSHLPYPRAVDVGIDDYQAAYEMTEYLLSLGHKKIGFVKGDPDHGGANDRYNAYMSALESANISYRPSFVKQGYYSYDSGILCARELLSGSDRPTAIFASNDEMAAAILSVAREFGIKVPGELSIAGFDDGSISQRVWPPITTIRQPVEALARAAVEGLIDGAKHDSLAQDRKVKLDFELIKRASTHVLRTENHNIK